MRVPPVGLAGVRRPLAVESIMSRNDRYPYTAVHRGAARPMPGHSRRETMSGKLRRITRFVWSFALQSRP